MQMASTTTNPDTDKKTCRLCKKLFNQPKLLPCGHHLCRLCLLTRLKAQKDEAKCPHCQSNIMEMETIPSMSSLDEVVDRLPTDASIEELVEADKILKQQHYCCVCEDVVAISTCLTCGDMLCSPCKRAHGKLSALKRHVVEDLSTLTADELIAHRRLVCSEHPEEVPKLFCPTHGSSICVLCASSAHKNCSEVDDLEDRMEDALEELAELAATLTTGEDDLGKAIGKLDQHLRATEQSLKAALAEIDEKCDRLEAAVKQNRHRLKDLMLKAFSDVRHAVHDGKNHLLKRQARLTSHKHVAHRVQRMKNYDPVNVMVPELHRRIHDLDFSTTLPANAKVVSTITFSIDPEALTGIEAALSELGEVQIVPTEGFASQLPVLRFHERHGQNIVLSNNQQTAERATQLRSDNGIVLSSDPLHYNTLYEVRVDDWADTYEQGSMCVGVVTQTPTTLTLPAWSGHLKSAAVVVRKNWVKNCVTGSQTSSGIGASLASLAAGSRVGVLLDSARSLHLYVNGEDQGIVAREVPRPCYALFDVCDDATRVTALPVTMLSTNTHAAVTLEKLLDPSIPETTM